MVNVPAPFKNGIQSFREKIEEKSNKTKWNAALPATAWLILY